MSSYDWRHWSERVKNQPFTVTAEQTSRMCESDPGLTEDQVAAVVDALNWDAIADPPGTIRACPYQKAYAIRIPDVNSPWEVVWFSGTGGGYAIGQIQKWPIIYPLPTEPTEPISSVQEVGIGGGHTLGRKS